ncbi:unnamed protein product, partial [Effrenium voratum]
QAASLLQTMHQHTKRSASSRGGICITSFLSIFEMAFHPMASRDVPAWVTCALREFGKTIWKAGEEGAMSFFKASDVDQNGRLSLPELATALEQLATTYGLKDVVGSRTEFLELARHVDLSGEGSVNYAEFVAGFMPVGLLHGSTFQLDVMESICTSIWANKSALRSLFLALDVEHSGRISREDLRKALAAVKAGRNEPLLTAEQVDLILEHTKFNAATHQVRYNRFLDSFKIFDLTAGIQRNGKRQTYTEQPVS